MSNIIDTIRNDENYQIMKGVSEYGDKDDVFVGIDQRNKTLVITAFNEGGNCRTDVDLLQLLEWVKNNLPEIFQSI